MAEPVRGGTTSEIPGTADVVIIGGGIVGVSAAFFLAGAGGMRVVVVERAAVGSGATGRAAGVILLQADSEAEVRLQLDSLALHRRLRDELGTDLAAHGSLLLWTSEEDAARATPARGRAPRVRGPSRACSTRRRPVTGSPTSRPGTSRWRRSRPTIRGRPRSSSSSGSRTRPARAAP